MKESPVFVIFFLSLFAIIAYGGVCDFKLGLCDTCTRSCVPFGGPCTCSPASAVNPICSGNGCPDGRACINGPSICDIGGIGNEVTALTNQITSLTNQVTTKTTELANKVKELDALEKAKGITYDKLLSMGNDVKSKFTAIGSSFTGLESTIRAGVELPVKVVKLFPKLFNDEQPDKITGFIQKRSNTVLSWFTSSLMKAAKGVGGGAQCATCLIEMFNDKSLSFFISLSDGPALGLGVDFSSIKPLQCFVNSLASLAVIMKDVFPTELVNDAFEETAGLLADAADQLAAFSTSIQKSKICNRSGDVLPVITDANTGLPALDDLLNKLTGFINTLGNGGIFGSIANGIVNGVCAANTTNDFQEFAKDVRNFVKVSSFPSIEDQIFKSVFLGISKLSEGLITFMQKDFNVGKDCNPNDDACRLSNKYGNSLVKCLQENFVNGDISFGFRLYFGEHWLTPFNPGWGLGLGFNTKSLLCTLGIESAVGTIKEAIQLTVGELAGFKGNENSLTTCSKTLSCGVGSFDASICACRCPQGYLSSTTCVACPGPANNVCNGNGICYFNSTGPACCCSNGRTTPACN